MNQERSHNFEILIGFTLTAILVIFLGIIILVEPIRIETAAGEVLTTQLEEAMVIYAENCSLCHGIVGDGIGSNPPLNSDALRSMDPIDLYKTISRGRYNTSMPAWEDTEGGPLSSYQIDEMVVLVRYGNWDEARNLIVNMGLAPLVPFTTQPDPDLMAMVAALDKGEELSQALTIYSSSCVSCHGADGLGTSIAPAINSDQTRSRTPDEIERIIQLGVPGTLMAGWQSVMPSEDLSAMVELVTRWDEIPLGTVPAPDIPIATTEESIALGGELYSANCSRCHGPEGQGTQRAPSLNVRSFLTDTNDQAIEQIVTNGVPGTAMPAWGTMMSEANIQAIVGFIRQWEDTAPEVASPVRGMGGPPWARATTTATSGSTVATNPQNDPETLSDGQAQNQTNGPMEQGQGNGRRWQQEVTATEPAFWETIDLKLIGLLLIVLSIVFSLFSYGISTLKNCDQYLANAKKKDPLVEDRSDTQE